MISIAMRIRSTNSRASKHAGETSYPDLQIGQHDQREAGSFGHSRNGDGDQAIENQLMTPQRCPAQQFLLSRRPLERLDRCAARGLQQVPDRVGQEPHGDPDGEFLRIGRLAKQQAGGNLAEPDQRQESGQDGEQQSSRAAESAHRAG